MRILAVQESDWIDRNPILHHRMLESLALAGDSVLVLDYDLLWHRKGRRPLIQGRREINDSTKFFAGSGVKVVRPAMIRIPGLARPTWLLMTTIELIRAFRRFGPEVVVAYGLSNALVARVLAALFRVPFVFHIFDALHTLAEPAILAPVARLVEGAVLRSSRVVIVVHRGMQDYLQQMRVRPDRIRFIMNGFEVREPDEGRVARLRRELGIADDEVMILFIGWLYSHSGLLEMARVLVNTNRYAGYRLVIAGDGDVLAELRAMAHRSPGGSRLVVLGKRPVGEMPDLIAAADVGLFAASPSLTMRNVVPAKVDEYLEVGRPIVATRLPGMLAELGALQSMIWVDGPQDALGTLDALLRGQTDRRAFLRHLGTFARDYGKQRETWAQVTARFRAALTEGAAHSVTE
jgi:glycosyltransferase involved in cell wall biosynthesis